MVAGRVKNKIVRKNERSGREEDGEEKIGGGEILVTIKRLKDGKVAGIDGIPGEV